MPKEATGIHRHGAGGAVAFSSLVLVVCLGLLCLANTASAGISTTGDVVPADPATWTSSTTSYIGKAGHGTMDVTSGSDVINNRGHIGYDSSSTGEVTVDGAGSTWTNTSSLYIGGFSSNSNTLDITNGGEVKSRDSYLGFYSTSGLTGEVTVDGTGSTFINTRNLKIGCGTLNITNGGNVSAADSTIFPIDSPGTIYFDNGTLTTGGLFSDFDELSGTGTINAHGLVCDIDLVFDDTHGLSQALSINYNPSQNITLNLSVDGSGSMGAGFNGVGTTSISDGIIVESTNGYIGYHPGSMGEVEVTGTGSTWTNGYELQVGIYDNSTGTLNISHGGEVSNNFGVVGYYSGSAGNVTVDGAGSTWTNRYTLSVGSSGSGTLGITDGGVVSNPDGYVGFSSGSTGEVTVDGAGSAWTNSDDLLIGRDGSGTLEVTDGGLVSVAGTLTIDDDADGNGLINMATGGMLALFGDADDSLVDFLGLINGTDAIRYWDDSISDWADITGATYGEDYTLIYLTEGDLAGYTVLTVKSVSKYDLDEDNDVDLGDFGMFAACFNGPNRSPTGGCIVDADFDDDSDVDLADFGMFAACFNGPNRPPACE